MPTLEPLPALFLGPLGMQELLIILMIALLIFGGKKIPELASGLGQGIRQFKSSLKGDDVAEAPAGTAKAGKDS